MSDSPHEEAHTGPIKTPKQLLLAVLHRADASFPDAEAWIFISIGLLGTVGRRVGSLLENDFEAIIASRRAWMANA